MHIHQVVIINYILIMKKIFFILMLLLCKYSYCQNVISISGKWGIQLDSLDLGESEKWFNHDLKDSIMLPGITDEAGLGNEFIEVGKLTRLHKYIGKAWYQTCITIPQSWNGKSIDLFLERIMWKSDLWIDNKKIGDCSSLSTPHIYSLGKLKPGKHRLTLRVDNSEIYPIGNLWSHSYGDQTQIIWNGILGRMELSAHPNARFISIRTFFSAEGKLKLEFLFRNTEKIKKEATVSLIIKEKKSGVIVFHNNLTYTLPSGIHRINKVLTIESPLIWDEFSPNMYTLECILTSNKDTDIYPNIEFGFRSLSKNSDYIVLNGVPRFLRGNLDCAVFPLTGYPPTNKEEWLQILKKYKDYGLNHVRFHSWTPPQAAFEAADELGLYILCEIFWRDGWMGKNLNVKAVAPFILSELYNISDSYGNHPSFIMQAIGNELGGFDITELDPLIAEVKKYDNRKFYLTSIRRPMTKHADIDVQGDLSSPYPKIFISEGRFSTDWDYTKWFGNASPLPNIQHEVGQWVFYPDWETIDKYNGLLRSRDMEKFKKKAIQYGVYKQNMEFVKSSGNQSLSLYKENIESFLRTPGCGGFQLLGMQDFTGQGVALVGWLDAFYDNKGIVSPKKFRQWCNTTVPLIRTSSYCYINSDTLKADVDIFHFALKDLPNKNVLWHLIDKDNGQILASGKFKDCNIYNTSLTKIGKLSIPLHSIEQAKQVILSVSLEGTTYRNDWNFWIFPEKEPTYINKDNIIETCNPDSAIYYMDKGANVLLWAYNLGSTKNEKLAQWIPAFWNGGESEDEGSLNGTFIQKSHPALKGFPTDSYLDYQWYDICKGGRGFVLRGNVKSSQPIIQPIHDFHFNRKLASLVEFKGKNGGKILICGYNLKDNIEKRPAALTLRNCLYRYIASEHFNPTDYIDYQWVKSELRPSTIDIKVPSEFKNAFLYVKAGAKINNNNKESKWNINNDGVVYNSNIYDYKVECENVIRYDLNEYYWSGEALTFEFKLPFDYKGYIKIHIGSALNKNEALKLYFNEKELRIQDYLNEQGWISIKINQGESLFSKAVVKLTSKQSKCLVDELALLE